MDIFFSADHHFNHQGIIHFCDRPWKNIWAMNEELVQRWNQTVSPGGLVYYLGDFGFGTGKTYGTLGIDEILDKLNGQIYFIHGSHDKPIEKLYKAGHPKIVKLESLAELVIDGQQVVLCHYAMRVWRKSHFDSWHLYGHSHGQLPAIGKSLDVGVDGHNFYPWNWNEIKEYMSNRPHNLNYVDREDKERERHEQLKQTD